MDHPYYYGLAPQRCAVCAATFNLRECVGCEVVSYCCAVHKWDDLPRHKVICAAIKRTRENLYWEETALRVKPSNVFLPADVFNTCVGKFWGILDTRGYMRARLAAADALLKANTVVAVEKALDHFQDMLRLCRSDNLNVRDIVPGLLLRLGREQECYDFLKRWAILYHDESYDWGDTTLPYLDIRNADAFEPIEVFCSGGLSVGQLATLTLLKLRLFLDLESYQRGLIDCRISDNRKAVHLLGEIVRGRGP